MMTVGAILNLPKSKLRTKKHKHTVTSTSNTMREETQAAFKFRKWRQRDDNHHHRHRDSGKEHPDQPGEQAEYVATVDRSVVICQQKVHETEYE